MRKSLKILTSSTLAAVLLLSGTAASAGKAFAAETTASASASTLQADSFASQLISYRLSTLVGDTAYVSGKKESDIYSSLASGQSLTQASGLSSSDILKRLSDIVNADLQEAVGFGIIPKDQLQAGETAASKKLSQVVDTQGYQVVSADGQAVLAHIVLNRLDRIILDSAVLSDKDEKDVRNDLSSGKSLVASSPLDPGELSKKLLDAVYQEIQYQVSANVATQADALKYYAVASEKISNIINTPGYQPEAAKPASSNLEQIVANRISNIISATASFADKDDTDVLNDLRSGKSLVASAASLEPGKLSEKLLDLLKQDLQFEVSQNRASQADADKYYAKGAAEISDIISTPGYQPEEAKAASSDLEQIVTNRISRIITDTANFADKDEKDVINDLRSGKSLVASAALESGKLYEKLTDLAKQDFQYEVSQNHASQADADKYYAEAAAKISDIISTPGYQPEEAAKPAPSDLEKIVTNRVGKVIIDTANFADKDLADVLSDLRGGKSLEASAALEPGKLYEKLTDLAKQDLQYEVSQNRASQTDADKYYAEAASKIADAISTPGYQVQK